MTEQGLCGKCGKSTDCLNTSIGWMCKPCFHTALKMPQGDGPRLFTLPEPGKKVYVVLEPPACFMTVSGTLYAFDREVDAQDLADALREGYGVKGAFVKYLDASQVLNYVLRNPALKLLGIKEKIKGREPSGPDEIAAPAL